MSRSIQQTQNNSASTQITEVGTNTGFSAGDLVYYNNGDYKGASSLTFPTSASFPATANLPVNPQSWVSSFSTPGGAFGGSGNKGAAVLTNGNIVQVLLNGSDGVPYFRIVDTSNVVQVASTSVSSTYKNTAYSMIGVLALTGGGFVVYWLNSSGGTTNTMNYAIYTNSGSVTTSPTQDTSFSLGANYGAVNGVALANGGFVLGTINIGGPNPVFRGYNATGVGQYSLVTLSPTMSVSSSAWVGMAARSDSSFIVFWGSSSSLYNYAIYSSTGVGLNTGSISVTSAYASCDVSTLSDGTTFVLVYGQTISSKYTPCFRFLPTGNVLGSEFTVPAANINKGYSYPGATNPMSVAGLSNGNFIMTFSDGQSLPSTGLNYAVFNSSGVSMVGTNAAGTVPVTLTGVTCGAYYDYKHILETSTGILIHWNSSNMKSNLSYSTYYAPISKTTYLPTGTYTSSTTVGSGTASSSGIGYAGSVPTALAVASASTQTISVSSSTAYVVQPTALYTTNALSAVSSATFPNGSFVIAYKDSVTYAVYASIFSVAGVLQQTISVGTGYATGYANGVSVATLPSGKFVVTYSSASSTYTNALYSSSYTFISATTFTGQVNSTYQASVAGLSNERYVVAYTVGSYSTFNVYDAATNTLIAGPTTVYTATSYNVGVCANNWGGFYVSFYYGGGGVAYTFGYYNTTGNTYGAITSWGYSSGNGVYNGRPVFANGMVYTLNNSNSGATYLYAGYTNDNVTSYSNGNVIQGLDTTSYANVGLGTTGLGNPVLFYPSSTTVPTAPLIAWETGYSQTWSATSPDITFPNASTFAGTGMSFRGNNGYGTFPTVTPNVGNNVVVTWCNSSGYLYYAIVTMVPATAPLALAAGVTSSTPIPVSPTAATSSTAIGATFVGVAAATVPAGSAGPVVTNGPAKLNANYTNTASGAFDHSGTPTGGVKGTYNGKIVNMQGNT